MTGSQEYYTLRNNPNFRAVQGFENPDQEFGPGLYATHKKDVRYWNAALKKTFMYPIDTRGLRVIHESDFPSQKEMVNDLKAAGYTASKITRAMPRGNTFNRNKMELAIKREWAKLQGIDAIVPFKNREAEQMIFINQNVRLGSPKRISEFFGLK
jgi:hypothetical protein